MIQDHTHLDIGTTAAAVGTADTAAFAVLSAFYSHNPDRDLVEAALALSPDDVDDGETRAALSLISSFASDTDDAKILDLKRDWTKLFRGVSPNYGPKPPYAALYAGRGELEVMSELATLYDEYGYGEYRVLRDRLDYIGAELGFVAFLAAARDQASRAMLPEQADRYGRALEQFLDRHFSPWFEQFRTDAMPHVATDFYRGVLDLTRRLCC